MLFRCDEPRNMWDAFEGQALFKPSPALQMFPLYLLAAQANLGLRRAKQCENYLGLACWISSKYPEQTTNIMSSQLHRLYGQMYSLQSRYDKALESFAEDIFCCSQEYGPLDVRTSLGFYNMGKVFEAEGGQSAALSNHAMVVRIWINALAQVVLGFEPYEISAVVTKDEHANPTLPLGTLQLIEVCMHGAAGLHRQVDEVCSVLAIIVSEQPTDGAGH